MVGLDQHRLLIYVTTAVTIIFVGIAYYLFWVIGLNLVETTKFGNFFAVLSFIGIILGFIVLITEYFKYQDEQATDDQNQRVNESQLNWIELEKMFITHYPYLDRLYSQMYPNNPALKDIKFKWTPEEWQKVKILETHTCSILFQIIENVCMTSDWTPEHANQSHYNDWLKIWQSWFQSPIVRRQWNSMKTYYTPETQKCVNTHLLPSPPPKHQPKLKLHLNSHQKKLKKILKSI